MKRTPLRRPIPEETRNIINSEPFYRVCILRSLGDCEGYIQINHALTYKGTRIDDLFSLMPMCVKHHKEEARYRRQIKEVILSRVTRAEILAKYPKMII